MQVLSFLIDGELYAADVAYVQKFVRNIPISPVRATPDSVIGIANMKGRVITVLSLAVLMGRDADRPEAPPPGGTVNAIVFKAFSDGDQIALRIDRPGGLLEIGEKQILPNQAASAAAEMPLILGIAEVDGRIYRIIHPSLISGHGNAGGKQ